MSDTPRPKGVTIVAWFVIVVSSLMAIAYITALPRPPAFWGLLESGIKIGLAFGMLKRVPWTRIAFLAFWFLSALGVDLVVYRDQLHDTAFLVPRFFIVLIGIVYAVILMQPVVRQWFGEDAPGPTPEQVRQRIGMAYAASGALLVAVSGGLLLFFAWHTMLDVLTFTTWHKTEATIIAADIKGNVVRQVPRSVAAGTSSGRRDTAGTTTEIVPYDPVITYRYNVGGSPYESSKFATMKTTISAQFNPRALRARYTPGSIQECWYDPDDPSNAVLQRGISPYYVFAIFLPIVLAVGRMLLREGRAGFRSAPP